MKLVYWVADCLDDSRSYSIRAPTKSACKAVVAAQHEKKSYGPVRKIEVCYATAFDLVCKALGEGGIE